MSKKLIVYDNGGETIDRFTVVCPDGSVFGMSDDPISPQGFNQYSGDIDEFPKGLEHTGERLEHAPDCVILGLKARGYTSLELFNMVTGD